MIDISIVMPTYNRINFLKQALDSVINQSYSDWELIIIDDGSTDGTGDFIKKNYHDRRIKYYYQKNRGEYPATNKAIKLAKGKYITWLHSDDFWPMNSLEDRINFFQKNPDCDFIHADIIKVNKIGKQTEKLIGSDLSSKKILENYCKKYYHTMIAGDPVKYVHHTSFLIKKDFFKKVGYLNEKLFHAGDFDWFLRALDCAKKIKHLPKVVYFYRTHPGTKRITDAKVVNENQVVKRILIKRCSKVCKIK